MARLTTDIVAKVHRNVHGYATDLIFEDGTRFYDTDHGLDFVLLFERSSGGGWPEVEIHGSYNAIKAWLIANEWDDIDYLMEECVIK